MGDRALKRRWRFLVSEPASGAWNMALDEALAESVRAGALPFVRFYFWERGTLSLGRFQNLDTGLTAEARKAPMVRRPTGGGGIWHENELTYSLGCQQDDLGVSGVKASFELLCGFLVDAWRSLGWDSGFARDAGTPGEQGRFTPACFAGQEEYDILVGGKKLGGNAQRRERTSIFQHGSLPIVLEHSVLERLFLRGFRPLPEAVTDLSACGWKGEVSDLILVLAGAFASRLGVEWEEGLPTERELRRAEELASARFGAADWTESGGGRLRGA